MKKLLTIALTLSVVFFACKNNEHKDITDPEKIDTATVVVADTQFTEVALKLELKYLPELIAQSDKKLKAAFDEYVGLVTKPITSEDDLKKIFESRYRLIQLLDEYLGAKYDKIDWDNFDNIDKELETIGIGCIYAEGMYVGMGEITFLKDQIEKFASEPFKLYLEFLNVYTNSMGGEYPFMNLTAYADVVAIGEKLYTNYKTTDYYKIISEKFINALTTMVDLHHAAGADDELQCFESGLSYEFYPYAADYESIQYFIDHYPKSKYVGIFKKLKKNMSEFRYNTESNPIASVYVIVVAEIENYEKTKSTIFEYLNKGIDAVHSVTLYRKDVELVYVAYRFYDDEQKAEEGLKTIQTKIPEAKIIHVNIFEGGKAIMIE